MTARDLIDLLGQRPALLVGGLLLLPLAVPLLRWIHGEGAGSRSPWRYLYAVIVYGACVPGVGAAVLSAYTLFFTRENLVDKNLLVYVLPVVSMALTLGLMRRQVAFDDVPGFDRLSGLMVLIAVSFAVVLAIKKTFVGILFGASIGTLLVIGAGVFALLKWGAHALFRRAASNLIVTVLLGLWAGCSSPTVPSTLVEPIQIVSVAVLVNPNVPPTAAAHVQGVVGDGCSTLKSVTQSRAGNVVTLTILRERPVEAVCTQIARLYDETIPLDGQYPAGRYTLRVNSFEAAFETR